MSQWSAVPPGWYPDPMTGAGLRWWDGYAWTAHHSAAPAFSSGPVPPTGNRELAWLLPVERTGLSVAAGYVGLFSILLVFAPISLILGILAIRDLRRRPGMLGFGRAVFAVVMGALFSAVLLAAVVANA